MDDGRSGSGFDTYLMTWNPAFSTIDEAAWSDGIAQAAAGVAYEDRWSTGQNTRMAPGDRVILLRQGTGVRGLVAAGWVESDVYQGDHWDSDHGGQANYADVRWESLLPLDAPLPTEELLASLPLVKWNYILGSGTRVKPEAVADLEASWSAYYSIGTSTPTTGTSMRQSAADRKLIEDRGQLVMTAWFESRKWEVSDVRLTNPFDAVATRDGETLYLEAKGTTGAGASVIVTKNEVRFAREHPGRCVIGVVSNIRLDDAPGAPRRAMGGDLRLLSWTPDDVDLTPLTYGWKTDDAAPFGG
ncbi:DUF3883 domain-containing protein [Cellulomonas humilata]|uniref:DUF3883 domain-containing protein n=1 Tax=Cellulomonas humilata TaxID=144055 RepID=A0A7Y6DYA5_9CELL|nr:DUF3883 domain-containing protein [Cellulomonas humilata]NUU18458.1 DUF3883 domain-containing protein [Cellulomonas humilata]